VDGDELLLLVQGVEEPEGVCAEAENGDDCKQRERAPGAHRHTRACAPVRRSEHHEWEDQTG
jgi:hypothetical protein